MARSHLYCDQAVLPGQFGAEKGDHVASGDSVGSRQGVQWCTSESTLHTIALLGGWPGALVARRVFRHKTKKQPFRTIFWATVLANCAALAWFVYEAPLTLP